MIGWLRQIARKVDAWMAFDRLIGDNNDYNADDDDVKISQFI